MADGWRDRLAQRLAVYGGDHEHPTSFMADLRAALAHIAALETERDAAPHPWDVQQNPPSWRAMYEEARAWGVEQRERAEAAQAEAAAWRARAEGQDG